MNRPARGHRLVLDHILENWRVCTTAIVGGLVQECFAFCRPIVYMVMVDRIVTSITPATIAILGALLILLGLFEAIASFVGESARLRLNATVGLALAARIWPAVANAAPDTLRRWRAGQILERIGGTNTVYATQVNVAYSAFVTLPFAVAVLVFVLSISVTMTAVALAAVPLTAGAGWLFARLRAPKLRSSYDQIGLFDSTAIETINNIELIHSFDAQEFVVRKLWLPFASAVDTSYSLGMLANVQARFQVSVRNVAQAVLLATGAYLVIAGKVSIGQLVAFDLMANQLQSRLASLSGTWSALQTSQVAADRLTELTSALPMDAPDTPVVTPIPVRETLALEDVAYAYDEGAVRVLENVSLILRTGEAVAIVGASGEGKSTVAKILAGLLPIETGRRLVDGITLDHDTARRAGVVYLPQEAAIFAGTLAENVALADVEDGDLETMGRIEEALKCAGVAELADSRGGVLASLTEGGRNLSGGQRQRVHLARLFHARRRICDTR